MKVADDFRAKPAELLDPDWTFVTTPALEFYSRQDWATLDAQREAYLKDQAAKQALDLLKASANAPTFGYQINNYQHCLQSATLCLQDGLDEESVVAALFHDVGFIVCNASHGCFAADLMSPYLPERQVWMLRHHAIFQQAHFGDFPDPSIDPDEREQWRGHPYFEWTAEFVRKYDQNTINPALPIAPIEVFEPIVERVFAQAFRE